MLDSPAPKLAFSSWRGFIPCAEMLLRRRNSIVSLVIIMFFVNLLVVFRGSGGKN